MKTTLYGYRDKMTRIIVALIMEMALEDRFVGGAWDMIAEYFTHE